MIMASLLPLCLLAVFFHTSSSQRYHDNDRGEQCLSLCGDTTAFTKLLGPPGPPGPRGRKGERGDHGSTVQRRWNPEHDSITAEAGSLEIQTGGPVPEGKTVAFSVTRQSRLVGTHEEQTITYNDKLVLHNANMDLETGVFTCEIPGIYQFSFTFATFPDKRLYIKLKHNDQAKVGIYLSPEVGQMAQSQSAMLHLERGDRVHLAMAAGTHYGIQQSGFYLSLNTFNGHMIYPDMD